MGDKQDVMRILLVEDDPVLADGVRAGLSIAGFTVDVVSTCADARAALAGARFDALVLDLMLPDGSGLDVLGAMRAGLDATPVLLLTALDETADKVRGLDTGADDYLGKPFDLDELGARLRALARRGGGRASPRLVHGEIELDPATLSVFRCGVPVAVSRREFAVLALLVERPGMIRPKGEIEERLYGWQEDIESNTVEVYIHNLRGKLGRDLIETVRGVGYRIRGVS